MSGGKKMPNVRRLAHAAVRLAVRSGALPSLDVTACADCGAPAVGYHHHQGYDRANRLAVQPLCRACHQKREHVAVAPEDSRKRLTIELREDEEEFVQQMRGRAIARGSTLRDWVVEAMREKAERDADK
jgi:hypothetical protein